MKLEDFFYMEGPVVRVKPIVQNYKSLAKLLSFHTTANSEDMFYKETAFVYFYLNKNAYSGYNDANRISAIKQQLQLPKKWEISKLLHNLIDDLKSDFETPSQKALRLSNKVLITFTEAMEQAIDDVGDTLAMLKEKSKQKDISSEEADAVKNGVKLLNEELFKLLKITNEIPKAILDNEKLTEKAKGDTDSTVSFGNKIHHAFESSGGIYVEEQKVKSK